MRSPLDPNVLLEYLEIEPGLLALQCPKSKGLWIPLPSYTVWREKHHDLITPLPPDYQPQVEDDSQRPALFCPESGSLLQRFRVGHGLAFRIDRSPVTGGIWLDSGEWEALKSRNLHHEMHLIFTAPYQKRIRDESREQVKQDVFRTKVGEEDFHRVDEFRRWMIQHPSAHEIRSFLMDRDNQG